MPLVTEAPNWYLDPAVAEQKRLVHLDWIRRNAGDAPLHLLLKTDLYEEAYGEDQLLTPPPVPALCVIGIDNNPRVAVRARGRIAANVVIADTRCLPFRDRSLSMIISNSTLDHFERFEDLRVSVKELARVLVPDGRLFITLDNPANPLYWLLRAASQVGVTPFPIGRTAGSRKLRRMVREAGLDVLSTDWLIHNPRVLSTVIFLAMRKLAGKGAGRMIAGLINVFAVLGHLPTRSLTASFLAVSARKPSAASK